MNKYHNFLINNNSEYKNLYEEEINITNLKNFKFTEDELNFLKNSYNLNKETFGNIYVDNNNKVIKTEYKVSEKYSSTDILDSDINIPLNYHSHPFSNRIMEPPSDTDIKYIVNYSLKKFTKLLLNKKKINKNKFFQYHLIFAPEGIYCIRLYADNKILKIYKEIKLLEFVDKVIDDEFNKKYKTEVSNLKKIKNKIMNLNEKNKLKKLENEIYNFYRTNNFKKESLLEKYNDNKDFKKLIDLNNKIYNFKNKFYKQKIGINYYQILKNIDKNISILENYLMKIEYYYNLSLNDLKKYNDKYFENSFKYKLISPYFFNFTSSKFDNITHDLKVKLNSNIQELTTEEMKLNNTKVDSKKIKFINDIFNKFYKNTNIKIELFDYSNFKLNNLSIIN